MDSGLCVHHVQIVIFQIEDGPTSIRLHLFNQLGILVLKYLNIIFHYIMGWFPYVPYLILVDNLPICWEVQHVPQTWPSAAKSDRWWNRSEPQRLPSWSPPGKTKRQRWSGWLGYSGDVFGRTIQYFFLHKVVPQSVCKVDLVHYLKICRASNFWVGEHKPNLSQGGTTL